MSTKKKDGGPAFPTQSSPYFTGMTLRDWFAGRALAALIASGDSSDDLDETAYNAYRQADAMLAERNRRNDE